MGAASLFVLLIVGLCAAQAEAYGCDMTRALRLNDTFTFNNFPPNAGYGHSGVDGYHDNGRERSRSNPFQAYSPWRRGAHPQECTWTFKPDGDCLLQFRTERYERGSVDCDEQYLLIGDENKEKRICGFARPPRRLNSSGRQLFVTHYKRNGYGESVASGLGGTVRCVKKEPPAPCPAWTNWTCETFDEIKCESASDCTTNITVTTLTTPGGSDSVSGLCPAAARCVAVRLGHSFAGTNATCDAPLPAVTFFEGATQGQCGFAQVRCPANDPECHFSRSYTVGPLPTVQASFACSFPPHDRCAAAVAFCFTIPLEPP